MLKSHVAAFVIGVIFGLLIILGGCLIMYKKNRNKRISEEERVEKEFAEKLRKTEEAEQKFQELLSRQTYVDLLTSKELTTWFKVNRDGFTKETKMIIAIPTSDHLRGLGYAMENELDTETNILQLFYDDEEGKVLKIRLINYGEIDSNLQAHLIEQEGMIVVTE